MFSNVYELEQCQFPWIIAEVVPPKFRFCRIGNGQLVYVVEKNYLNHMIHEAMKIETIRELRDKEWPCNYWDAINDTRIDCNE